MAGHGEPDLGAGEPIGPLWEEETAERISPEVSRIQTLEKLLNGKRKITGIVTNESGLLKCEIIKTVRYYYFTISRRADDVTHALVDPAVFNAAIKDTTDGVERREGVPFNQESRRFDILAQQTGMLPAGTLENVTSITHPHSIPNASIVLDTLLGTFVPEPPASV